jgi:3-methyladenine DNA glycosylase AlkD
MDVGRLAAQIDAELRARGTAERADHEKAYLRSEREHYGTTVPAIRSIAKPIRARFPAPDHADLIDLVEVLWSTPVHERRMAAVELLDLYVDRLQRDDMSILERLLRDARTWALVDGLAASVVGSLVERHPD